MTYPQFNFLGKTDEYIIITSLNLGGAEKIVTDQLWANYFNPKGLSYTLIVLYNKDKEHPVPPDVNVVRLNGNINQGNALFQLISFRNKTLTSHLLNDTLLEHLFSFNIKINIVIHNDQQGWCNKPYIFNHTNVTAITSICHYVTRQIAQYTDKPIITLRHQINLEQTSFNASERDKFRNEFNILPTDKVIGMLGRIAWQKNYPKAIEILNHLLKIDENWKLMIIGGFESSQQEQYIHLCKLINYYNIQKNVIFTGFRTDAKTLINAFDISLNTSHFEGLSMATQELLGNGLDVFCPKVCGQDEIFDPKKQIHFYSIGSTPEQIAESIRNHINSSKPIKPRQHNFTSIELQKIKKQSWASHRVWNLLHNTNLSNLQGKTAFLTSNLNLGGAQKSLFNLLTHFKKQNIEYPLIIANKSTESYLLNELTSHECETFLATDSCDAFDITNSILEYCKQNNISKIIYWNVDSKLKLLINKLTNGWIKTIDVSPGHYCFEEMSSEKEFMEGIYFNEYNYYQNLTALVFKYDIDINTHPFLNETINKTHIIQNGVNLKPLSSLTTTDLKIQQNINEIKQRNPDSLHFVVCGRIVQSKHIDIIIKAFQKIQKQHPHILHFIGEEQDYDLAYFKHIKELTKDDKDIYFHGKSDDPQYLLGLFDCLIVLGTHQGCPNIALEAFACNLPVIANDSGGTREIVNEQTGILLPEKPDSELLFYAINSFISNIQEYKEKAKNGFNLISKDFSMDKMAERYFDLINKS